MDWWIWKSLFLFLFFVFLFVFVSSFFFLFVMIFLHVLELLYFLGFFRFFFLIGFGFSNQTSKPLFNFLYLFFLSLFYLILDGCHISRHSFLFDFLHSSEGLQILLFNHFSCEYFVHDVSFILLHRIQRFTKFEDCYSTVIISNGCKFSTQNLVSSSNIADFDGSQWSIRNFVGEGNFILFVVVIPYIEPTILSGEEESTNSCWRETTVTQVTFMIFSLNKGSFEVIHPDLSTPITNGHEHLRILEISNNGIDWPQMSIIMSQSVVDFNWSLWLFVGDNQRTLLSTNDVFSCSLRTVF